MRDVRSFDLVLLRRALPAPLLMFGALVIAAAAALLGAEWTEATIDTIYRDRVVPLRQLREIEGRLHELRLQALAPAGATGPSHEALALTLDEVSVRWREYLATWLTPEEQSLAAVGTERLDALRGAAAAWRAERAAPPSQALVAELSALEQALEPLYAVQDRVVDAYRAKAHTVYLRGMYAGVLLLGVALAAGIAAVRLAYVGLRRNDYLLTHDASTGLMNLGGLRERLEREQPLYSGVCLAAWFHFDSVLTLRSLFGNAAVEDVMRALGERLWQGMGPAALVARTDAAGLLVTVRAVGDADEALVRLESLLTPPVRVFGVVVPVTWNCGVAVFAAEDFDVCLEHARIAVVRGWIERKRGFLRYSDSMHEALVRSVDALAALAAAVAEDRVRIVLQPQVALPGRALIGAEALVRVRSAEGRDLPPAQFIPFAEESGMIVPVGERVRELAVAELVRWRETGCTALFMSINLSVRELTVAGMAERFIGLVRERGVDAARIVLEITETAFSLADSEAQDNLERLQQHGFRLSIDDFGTGESSLGRLADLHAHELKIDRSLVSRIATSERALTITRLCCDIGHALAFEVLAEGVENEEECRIACELGATRGQGWLFGRPVPPDDFLQLVQAS